MRTQNPLQRLILLLALCAFVVGTAACAGGTEAGPRAWIDFPRDGAAIPVGSSVTVISHANAEEGVAEVLLSVNGEAYRRDPPEEAGASFSEARQEWRPEEAGLYTLQVRTYDAAGAVSSPHGITVRVVGEVAAAPTDTPTITATATNTPTNTPSPTHTPTLTITPTPVSPTPTFTSTPITPTPTFTPTPITPTPTFTPTSFPLAEVAFWVERDTITAGECTTLHWAVEYVTAVYLDGAGVGGHGTQRVCPYETTTYNLHVEAPSGNVDRSVTVTVNVSTPSDTTPPPVPVPMVPADELHLSCRTAQALTWLPVDDDSGITGYYVKLELQVTTTQWDSVREWGPVPDKQTETEVQCGPFYRWAVRARDGAGNISNWSAWSHFSVGID